MRGICLPDVHRSPAVLPSTQSPGLVISSFLRVPTGTQLWASLLGMLLAETSHT